MTLDERVAAELGDYEEPGEPECPKCGEQSLEWDYDEEAGYGEVHCSRPYCDFRRST